jgi:mono/diheme cytochrome c family protein
MKQLPRQSDLACACAAIALIGACRDDPMVDQAKYEAFEASGFFADGASARPRVPGTVARHDIEPADLPRPPIDLPLLRRGRERFDIFCAPCHGRDGYGEGTIVLRGYPLARSFHDERLRTAPDEHFYAVIEKGMGKMPPYASSVSPRDRWAIIAYIRALQLSQNARPADVPDDHHAELNIGREKEAAPNNAH